MILTQRVDIVAQAKTYEENGAAMISVLTDEVTSGGDIFLFERNFVRGDSSQPWLRTSLLQKQIVRSRNAGSDSHSLDCSGFARGSSQELYDFRD